MLIWPGAGLCSLLPVAAGARGFRFPVVLVLVFAPDGGLSLGHSPERLQLAALSAVSHGTACRAADTRGRELP